MARRRLKSAGRGGPGFRAQTTRPRLAAVVQAGSEQGMFVPTLGVVLFLAIGSSAMVASALNWQAALSRGGESEQAREAAEIGFNAIIEKLNNPGNHYLLITQWLNNDWVGVSGTDLAKCNIVAPSAGLLPRSEIISSTYPVAAKQVGYVLLSYRPPLYPSGPPTSLPAECQTKFGNLSGGSAQVVIRGDVIRNGSISSSYTIQRSVTIDAQPDLSASTASTAFNTVSAPLAFLDIGGGNSTSIAVDKTSVLALDSDQSWTYNSGDANQTVYCLGATESQCRKDSSSLGELGSNLFNVSGYSLDDFTRLYPANPPAPAQITSDSWSSASVNADIAYPYSSGTTLRSNCRRVSLPAQGAQNIAQEVIACKVNDILLDGTNNLTVNTSALPVALYVFGKMELKGGQIINTTFRDNRVSQPTSWSRLRIFGNPTSSFLFPITASTTPGSCTNGATQPFLIEKESRINGSFVWAPKAIVEFKEPTGNGPNGSRAYSMFGSLWACKTTYEKKVRFLTNSSLALISEGLVQAFGLQGQESIRYVARGIERSQ